MARLRVVREGVELQNLDLARLGKSSLSLGRAPESDIRLEDRAIGREHAIILLNSKGVSIQRKSKFGKIFVNGSDLAECVIKPGDVILIADYQVKFEEETPETEVARTGLNPPELASIQEGDTNDLNLNQISGGIQEEGLPESSGLSLETSDPDESAPGIEAPTSDDSVSIPAPSPEGGVSEENPPMVGEGDFGGEERTAMISNVQVVTKLVFKPGDANVEEYIIKKGEISIGRGTNCDVILTGKKSSRKHVLIQRVGMNFVLKDLGSVNGTYLNGVKVSDQELAGDDVIKIGETEFSFKAINQDYFDKQQEFIAVPTEEAPPEPDLSMPLQDPIAMPIDPQQPGGFDSSPIVGADGDVIPGLAAGPPKKETLIDKFKRQPKNRQIMIGAAIGLVVLMIFSQDEDVTKKETKKAPAVAEKVDASFASLPNEKKQFVINTYQLAFDNYSQKEYEKAAYEIDKILAILPGGYKQAKEIKGYAQKSIEIVKAAEEERRRKEAEEKLRIEVGSLVAKATALVEKGGKEAEVKEVFAQVLERDPDNATILRLRQQLEERETKAKEEAELAKETEFKKKQLETFLREGRDLLKAGKYYEVMEKMEEAPVIFARDEQMLNEAKGMIVEAKSLLKGKIRPHLEVARAAMSESNFQSARDAYYKTLKIDDRNVEAKIGLGKIKDVLHERSKRIYTDASIAEGISDYKSARTKYKECLDSAMREDIYFGRCSRKFKRFEMIDRGTASDPTPGGSDPQMPSLPKPVEVETAKASDTGTPYVPVTPPAAGASSP